MASDLAHYVIRFFGDLMTEDEAEAYRHLTMVYKSADGATDAETQTRVRAMPVRGKLLTSVPGALSLAAEGFDAFLEQTAARILREHPGKVFLNRCPQCQALTRTPRARLCVGCGHSWHSRGGAEPPRTPAVPASFYWSSARVGAGLPLEREVIGPAWLGPGRDGNEEGWSLVCTFDHPPAAQGNPSRGWIRYFLADAPHDALKSGAVLRLFDGPFGYTQVEVRAVSNRQDR